MALPFTDDDLMRLKEIAANKVLVNPPAEIGWWWRHTAALIARLEAAENVIAKHFELMNISQFKEVEAWRKAAGK